MRLSKVFNLSIAVLLLIPIFFVSCTREVDYNNPYSGSEIKVFEVADMSGKTHIDLINTTIVVPVKPHVILDAITATFVLSDGATATVNGKLQESGITKNDFRDTVQYLVTSGNKQNQTIWKVILVKKEFDDINTTTKNLKGTIEVNRVLSPTIYTVDENIIIEKNISLEIPPGTKLLIAPKCSIKVKEGGKIIALGTSNLPITFDLKEDAEGKWEGIHLQNASAEFTFCIFKNGAYSDAMIKLTNSVIGVKNSNFLDAQNSGLYLDDNSIFRVFELNTIVNCGENIADAYPIYLQDIKSVSNIGNTNKITSNKGIFIAKSNSNSNIKFFGQTCPFIFANDIIFDGHNTSIVILSGSTFHIPKGKSIKIAESQNVKFLVQGTEDNPVVFTTKNKTPGDWKGVFVSENLLLGSAFNYCNIEYAGAHENEKLTGAITCKGTKIDNLTINNCKITSPTSHGLYFFKDSDATLIDNKFENIPPENSNIFYEQ